MGTAVTILIAVFTLLLGIIGYYIVRENNRQDERHREQKETNTQLYSMIGNFNDSVGTLNTTMQVIQKELVDHQTVCEYKFVKK